MDPVFNLWKVDDKEWLKTRQEEWRIFEERSLKGASKREVSERKRFYIKGVKGGYIGGGKSYIYCPFTTSDEARIAFFSGLFGRSERENIVSTFVFYGMLQAGFMPWIRDSMKSFSLGVLGGEYKSIHCYDMNGSKIRAPNASFFCDHFSRCAIEVFEGEWDYHGCIECFDYFFSALSSDFRPKKPEHIRIPALLKAAKEYLQTGSDEHVLHFAQQIALHHQEMTEIYESWFG